MDLMDEPPHATNEIQECMNRLAEHFYAEDEEQNGLLPTEVFSSVMLQHGGLKHQVEELVVQFGYRQALPQATTRHSGTTDALSLTYTSVVDYVQLLEFLQLVMLEGQGPSRAAVMTPATSRHSSSHGGHSSSLGTAQTMESSCSRAEELFSEPRKPLHRDRSMSCSPSPPPTGRQRAVRRGPVPAFRYPYTAGSVSWRRSPSPSQPRRSPPINHTSPSQPTTTGKSSPGAFQRAGGVDSESQHSQPFPSTRASSPHHTMLRLAKLLSSRQHAATRRPREGGQEQPHRSVTSSTAGHPHHWSTHTRLGIDGGEVFPPTHAETTLDEEVVLVPSTPRSASASSTGSVLSSILVAAKAMRSPSTAGADEKASLPHPRDGTAEGSAAPPAGLRSLRSIFAQLDTAGRGFISTARLHRVLESKGVGVSLLELDAVAESLELDLRPRPLDKSTNSKDGAASSHAGGTELKATAATPQPSNETNRLSLIDFCLLVSRLRPRVIQHLRSAALWASAAPELSVTTPDRPSRLQDEAERKSCRGEGSPSRRHSRSHSRAELTTPKMLKEAAATADNTAWRTALDTSSGPMVCTVNALLSRPLKTVAEEDEEEGHVLTTTTATSPSSLLLMDDITLSPATRSTLSTSTSRGSNSPTGGSAAELDVNAVTRAETVDGETGRQDTAVHLHRSLFGAPELEEEPEPPVTMSEPETGMPLSSVDPNATTPVFRSEMGKLLLISPFSPSRNAARTVPSNVSPEGRERSAGSVWPDCTRVLRTIPPPPSISPLHLGKATSRETNGLPPHPNMGSAIHPRVEEPSSARNWSPPPRTPPRHGSPAAAEERSPQRVGAAGVVYASRASDTPSSLEPTSKSPSQPRRSSGTRVTSTTLSFSSLSHASLSPSLGSVPPRQKHHHHVRGLSPSVSISLSPVSNSSQSFSGHSGVGKRFTTSASRRAAQDAHLLQPQLMLGNVPIKEDSPTPSVVEVPHHPTGSSAPNPPPESNSRGGGLTAVHLDAFYACLVQQQKELQRHALPPLSLSSLASPEGSQAEPAQEGPIALNERSHSATPAKGEEGTPDSGTPPRQETFNTKEATPSPSVSLSSGGPLPAVAAPGLHHSPQPKPWKPEAACDRSPMEVSPFSPSSYGQKPVSAAWTNSPVSMVLSASPFTPLPRSSASLSSCSGTIPSHPPAARLSRSTTEKLMGRFGELLKGCTQLDPQHTDRVTAEQLEQVLRAVCPSLSSDEVQEVLRLHTMPGATVQQQQHLLDNTTTPLPGSAVPSSGWISYVQLVSELMVNESYTRLPSASPSRSCSSGQEANLPHLDGHSCWTPNHRPSLTAFQNHPDGVAQEQDAVESGRPPYSPAPRVPLSAPTTESPTEGGEGDTQSPPAKAPTGTDTPSHAPFALGARTWLEAVSELKVFREGEEYWKAVTPSSSSLRSRSEEWRESSKAAEREDIARLQSKLRQLLCDAYRAVVMQQQQSSGLSATPVQKRFYSAGLEEREVWTIVLRDLFASARSPSAVPPMPLDDVSLPLEVFTTTVQGLFEQVTGKPIPEWVLTESVKAARTVNRPQCCSVERFVRFLQGETPEPHASASPTSSEETQRRGRNSKPPGVPDFHTRILLA